MILEFVLVSFIFSLVGKNVLADECRGDLTVVVNGLKNSDGQIKFDLDDNAETFKPKENGKPSFAKGKSPIKDKRVDYVFKDIPCGEYAFKFYHDENMNETLDRSFLIPKEEYGFSNCKGCMLPPTWEKAKFIFDKEHPILTIEL